MNASAAGTVDGTAISNFETINTLAGDDSVTVNNSGTALTLNTGDGSDSLTSTTTADTLNVSAANTGTLGSISFSNLENVTLGAGADTATIAAGASLSTLNAGAGSDTLNTNASANSLVVNASAAGTVDGTAISNFETINTLAGDDSVTVNNSATALTLDAGTGSDSLTSTTTADTLTVSAANTGSLGSISFSNLENVTLGTGADTATIAAGASLSSLNAGAGSDTLNTNASANSLTINAFAKGTVDGTNISNFETIDLKEGSDTVAVNNSSTALTLNAGDGNDSLTVGTRNILITDNFDSNNGWTGGSISSGSPYYGNFLGQFSNGPESNGQDAYKTFAVDGQAVTVSFDVNRLDSWDGESFSFYVNDTVAFQTNFNLGNNIGSSSGTNGAYGWSITAKDSNSDHGFSYFPDQTATVSVTIPAGNSSLKLGFGSTIDQDASDESYGIDNLTISSGYNGNLNVSGANSGTLDSITFSNLENVTLGIGNETATIAAGGSLTSLNAGAGADTLNPNASANSLVINASAAGTVDGTAISNFETINTLDGNDSVTVNSSATALTINTGSGTDSLTSTTTADSLTVSAANAGNLGAINFTGVDNVTLGAGADTATMATSTYGALSSLDAGAGADTLNVNAYNNNLTINATATGSIDGTAISNFETINTLDGYDSVTVNNSSTALALNTGDGWDYLTSTTNADTLTVSGSNSGALGSINFSNLENVTLGSGSDTSTFTTGGGLSGSLNLGEGNNSITFNSGAGTLGGHLYSGNGNDTVTFNGGNINGSVDLGAGTNSLTINSNGSTIGGNLTMGGTDTLSYAGYTNPVNVSLTSATSGNATAIGGIVSGLDNLVGGSGSSDTLNAQWWGPQG